MYFSKNIICQYQVCFGIRNCFIRKKEMICRASHNNKALIDINRQAVHIEQGSRSHRKRAKKPLERAICSHRKPAKKLLEQPTRSHRLDVNRCMNTNQSYRRNVPCRRVHFVPPGERTKKKKVPDFTRTFLGWWSQQDSKRNFGNNPRIFRNNFVSFHKVFNQL